MQKERRRLKWKSLKNSVWLLWNYTDDGQACIYRVFSHISKVTLPSHIYHFAVARLAPYCFANRRMLPESFYLYECRTEEEQAVDSVRACHDFEEALPMLRLYHDFEDVLPVLGNTGCHEICGNDLENIVLPDTVRMLGAYCFFDCRDLTGMTVSRYLTMIENDVFMNCSRLASIFINGTVKEPSGLRQIVSQISWYLEVSFIQNEKVEITVIFPEYFETYDEIAPAHLFGRNISGEGFRARQCFQNGIFDLAQYDSIFQKMCVEEAELTASLISFYRLFYPIDLKEDAKKLYVGYIKSHDLVLAAHFTEVRKLRYIEFLIFGHYISSEVLKTIIVHAAEQDWPEGCAALLKLKTNYSMEDKKPRYSFDEDW